MYKVVSTFPLNGNTAVTISGDGKDLSNGIYVKNEKGKLFYLISVACNRKTDLSNIFNETELLIDGKFSGKTLEKI